MVRVLTWNVNGLRAALRRCDSCLLSFLDSLQAEIVCLQETKLTRTELLLEGRDLSVAEGWESYFSCTRGKTGYSGTATFCKASLTVPNSAEEGFTGLLQLPGSKGSASLGDTEALLQRFDHEELLQLDAEGRCVVTDHGTFVLFNVYAPALSNAERLEERFAFKLRLFEALFMRMEALRSRGRNIVLVGDLNIAPAGIDSCDPGEGGEFNTWLNRADRAFLRSHISSQGGAYVDIFRRYHPDRGQAYTCWNQASGARINNYGTRIDLILVAGASHCPEDEQGFASSWVASDIQPERAGSDHAPAWADIDPLQPLACAATPPPLSSRFLFTGKQQTLASWLGTRADSSSHCSSAHPGGPPASATLLHNRMEPAASQVDPASQPSQAKAASKPADVFREIATQQPAAGKRPGSAVTTASKRAKPAQRKMRQFFGAVAGQPAIQKPPVGFELQLGTDLDRASASLLAQQSAGGKLEGQTGVGSPSVSMQDGTAVDTGPGSACSDGQEQALSDASAPTPDALAVACQNSQVDHATAAAAWRQIKQKMQPPKCPGHNENCVIREVKKPGPNKGRLFYVCARADGPKPHGRCNHFEWVGDRKIRGGGSG